MQIFAERSRLPLGQVLSLKHSNRVGSDRVPSYRSCCCSCCRSSCCCSFFYLQRCFQQLLFVATYVIHPQVPSYTSTARFQSNGGGHMGHTVLTSCGPLLSKELPAASLLEASSCFLYSSLVVVLWRLRSSEEKTEIRASHDAIESAPLINI